MVMSVCLLKQLNWDSQDGSFLCDGNPHPHTLCKRKAKGEEKTPARIINFFQFLCYCFSGILEYGEVQGADDGGTTIKWICKWKYGNGESNTCSSDHKMSFLPFFFFVMFTGPPYSKVCIPLKK